MTASVPRPGSPFAVSPPPSAQLFEAAGLIAQSICGRRFAPKPF